MFPWSRESKNHFVGRVWNFPVLPPYFWLPIHERAFTGAASGKGSSAPAAFLARASLLSLQASTVTCRALVPGIPPTSIRWDNCRLICLLISTIPLTLIGDIETCLLLIFCGELTQQQENWHNLNYSPVAEALLVILGHFTSHRAAPRLCSSWRVRFSCWQECIFFISIQNSTKTSQNLCRSIRIAPKEAINTPGKSLLSNRFKKEKNGFWVFDNI